MKLNNKAYLPIIMSAVMLTGCGSSDYSSGGASENFAASKSEGVMADSAASYDYAPAATAPSYDSYDENGDYAEAAENPASSANAEKASNTSAEVIKKEMLVYTCNMSVDVLDFKTATDTFKMYLQSFGAFVENESYSDGGSGGRYYRADAEKWQSYNATVRVPSENYEQFCDAAAALGDLRSKNANVQNMSREYYDLSDTLEIYEAKEKRYKDLLKTIQDEEYAITVERELTDIQIEISKLRTRMNDIRTDVAYSYVYITINEVKEYQAEPVKTDTFLERLGNTVSGSVSSFAEFMEDILFLLIYLFPHLIIIGIIVFIVVKLVKRSKKRKAEKYAAAAAVPSSPAAPAAPAAYSYEKPQDSDPVQSDKPQDTKPADNMPADGQDKKNNGRKK